MKTALLMKGRGWVKPPQRPFLWQDRYSKGHSLLPHAPWPPEIIRLITKTKSAVQSQQSQMPGNWKTSRAFLTLKGTQTFLGSLRPLHHCSPLSTERNRSGLVSLHDLQLGSSGLCFLWRPQQRASRPALSPWDTSLCPGFYLKTVLWHPLMISGNTEWVPGLFPFLLRKQTGRSAELTSAVLKG
jgi:hypothetical protein